LEKALKGTDPLNAFGQVYDASRAQTNAVYRLRLDSILR